MNNLKKQNKQTNQGAVTTGECDCDPAGTGQALCVARASAVCVPAVDVLQCAQRYKYKVHKHSMVNHRDEAEMVSLAR